MAEKKNNVSKRLDSNRIKLRKGKSQRKNGTYDYRWTTPNGKRHTIYAATLDELRKKKRRSSAINETVSRWKTSASQSTICLICGVR